MDAIDPRANKKRIRTISELTEEQIQQKRQVDRKAQRAFRQRTRDRIADLECQVAQLQQSSSRRESELHHEIRILSNQNKTLARRLANIAGLATNSHVDDADWHDNLGTRICAFKEV
jgi:hypothetical protein